MSFSNSFFDNFSLQLLNRWKNDGIKESYDYCVIKCFKLWDLKSGSCNKDQKIARAESSEEKWEKNENDSWLRVANQAGTWLGLLWMHRGEQGAVLV